MRGGDELEDVLGHCDEAFYHSDEDIEGRLFDFIKMNKAKIRLRSSE